MTNRCPDCSAALKNVRVRDAGVGRCSACGGLWFPEHEVAVLRAEVIAPTAKVRLTSPRVAAGNCPSCESSILAAGRLGVKPIAACSKCGGVWVSKAIVPATRSDEWSPVAEILELLVTLGWILP